MSGEPCAWIEEQALHRAALAFVRTRFQPLEVRMRVDRAREVTRLVAKTGLLTDQRDILSADELEELFEKAEELARLTLLHAGCRDAGLIDMPVKKTEVELLVEKIRKEVSKAFGKYDDQNQLEQVMVDVLSKIAVLVEPEEDRT